MKTIGITKIKIGSCIKSAIAVAAMFLGCFSAQSQVTLDTLLVKVQTNNLSLQAARKALDAHKAEGRIGLLPNNPKVSMGYMPGNSSAIGTKEVFSITQSFDFPTNYLYKSGIAKSNDAVAEAAFREQVQSVLVETAHLYYKIVAANRQSLILERRISNAKQISESFQIRLQKGEGNILDFNKAKLQLTALTAKQNEVLATREQLREQLRNLNGSVTVEVTDTTFETKPLSSFEDLSTALATNNPTIAAHQSAEMMARKQLSLSRAQWLPEFEIGYEMEKTLGDKFAGVRVGMSIPLWQNKGAVKHANFAYKQRQSETQDATAMAVSRLQQDWQKAQSLQASIASFESDLASQQTNELLQKSLLAGGISVIQYFQETSWLYEMEETLTNMQLEYAYLATSIAIRTRL